MTGQGQLLNGTIGQNLAAITLFPIEKSPTCRHNSPSDSASDSASSAVPYSVSNSQSLSVSPSSLSIFSHASRASSSRFHPSDLLNFLSPHIQSGKSSSAPSNPPQHLKRHPLSVFVSFNSVILKIRVLRNLSAQMGLGQVVAYGYRNSFSSWSAGCTC